MRGRVLTLDSGGGICGRGRGLAVPYRARSRQGREGHARVMQSNVMANALFSHQSCM